MNDVNFDEFWAAYPRKKGKKEAQAKYLQAIKRAPHSEIMKGLEAFKHELRQKGTKVEFIPWARTWLHNDRWEDAQDLTPERCGPVPYDQMTDAEKRQAAKYIMAGLDRISIGLSARGLLRLKAEGYLQEGAGR